MADWDVIRLRPDWMQWTVAAAEITWARIGLQLAAANTWL